MDTDPETLRSGNFTLRTVILLVEDEAPIRQMTALLLRRLGYLVQEASSGEEALHWAQANREKIDLLITDVLMPGISGRELAEVLHSRGASFKVLFLSGHPAGCQGAAQPEAGFLQKPFTLEAVSKKIKEILGRS
jgi:two-component system cell cycle sensor histidine kinase/response regulator CckA